MRTGGSPSCPEPCSPLLVFQCAWKAVLFFKSTLPALRRRRPEDKPALIMGAPALHCAVATLKRSRIQGAVPPPVCALPTPATAGLVFLPYVFVLPFALPWKDLAEALRG